MRELLVAGILYLTGVGILLLIKPRLIFTERGAWKEFGIGRNPESYTWMPFWLFCIFWALISYSLVFVIIRKIDNAGTGVRVEAPSLLERPQGSPSPRIVRTTGLRRSNRVPAYDYYAVNQAPAGRGINNGPARYIYYGEPNHRSAPYGSLRGGSGGQPEIFEY